MVNQRLGSVRMAVQTKAADYTVTSSEGNTMFIMNSSSATSLSILSDALVNFPISTRISVTRAGSGAVTVNAPNAAFALSSVNSSCNVIKVAANTWLFEGDGVFGTPVEYLVVAGGGSGGPRSFGGLVGVGGGGAGGLVIGTNYPIIGQNTLLTVGAGGARALSGNFGNQGVNSVFNNVIALGGGAGQNSGGANGGSGAGRGGGGGAGFGGNGLQPTSTSGGFGNSGGYSQAEWGGGGGGGAGQVGQNASEVLGGAGGNGLQVNITGSNVYYAGGGAGGGSNLALGGLGGGAAGNSQNATVNTGGGGSGTFSSGQGGAGGSGIIILKYSDLFTVSNPAGGLTFTTTTDGVHKITIFTAGTGNIQFNI